MSTTSNDASSSSTSREELLQSHVAQLKAELQKERAETRQIHHDKVREIKTVREKEQANAREQLENLKLKLQKEKAQELQVNLLIVQLSLFGYSEASFDLNLQISVELGKSVLVSGMFLFQESFVQRHFYYGSSVSSSVVMINVLLR